MSLSHTSNSSNYEAVRDVILKYAENRDFAVDAAANPSALSRIHDDNDVLAGGNLTIGYGLNLDNDALSADDVVNAIEYALTTSVSPAANVLTATQQAGLQLLHDWKTGMYSDAYILDLVAENFSPGSGEDAEVRQARHDQLMSLSLNDEQATRLLHASIWGLKDENDQDILPNREAELTNRLSGQNKWNIDAGAVPESNERAALLSLYYNSPKLIGEGLLTAIATDNRAEAWWEIRYNSNDDASIGDGIAARRYYESQVFGLYSDYIDPTLSDEQKDLLKDSGARGVFRMYSLHRDESLQTYDNTVPRPNRAGEFDGRWLEHVPNWLQG